MGALRPDSATARGAGRAARCAASHLSSRTTSPSKAFHSQSSSSPPPSTHPRRHSLCPRLPVSSAPLRSVLHATATVSFLKQIGSCHSPAEPSEERPLPLPIAHPATAPGWWEGQPSLCPGSHLVASASPPSSRASFRLDANPSSRTTAERCRSAPPPFTAF